MAKKEKCKGKIAILTGGGDVPGLNPAIRAVTIRALREGFEVIGIYKDHVLLKKGGRKYKPSRRLKLVK